MEVNLKRFWGWSTLMMGFPWSFNTQICSQYASEDLVIRAPVFLPYSPLYISNWGGGSFSHIHPSLSDPRKVVDFSVSSTAYWLSRAVEMSKLFPCGSWNRKSTVTVYLIGNISVKWTMFSCLPFSAILFLTKLTFLVFEIIFEVEMNFIFKYIFVNHCML